MFIPGLRGGGGLRAAILGGGRPVHRGRPAGPRGPGLGPAARLVPDAPGVCQRRVFHPGQPLRGLPAGAGADRRGDAGALHRRGDRGQADLPVPGGGGGYLRPAGRPGPVPGPGGVLLHAGVPGRGGGPAAADGRHGAEHRHPGGMGRTRSGAWRSSWRRETAPWSGPPAARPGCAGWRTGDAADLQTARAAGYRCLEEDLDRSGSALAGSANASTLLQRVSSWAGDVSVWLGGAASAAGTAGVPLRGGARRGQCLAAGRRPLEDLQKIQHPAGGGGYNTDKRYHTWEGLPWAAIFWWWRTTATSPT